MMGLRNDDWYSLTFDYERIVHSNAYDEVDASTVEFRQMVFKSADMQFGAHGGERT